MVGGSLALVLASAARKCLVMACMEFAGEDKDGHLLDITKTRVQTSENK
jgi:hypothetical protein